MLVVAFLFGQLPKFSESRMDANASAELRTTLEDARGAADDGIALSARPPRPGDAMTGNERAVALIRYLLAKSSQHRVTYVAAVTEAELDRILEPKALLADGGVRKARTQLNALMQAYETYAASTRGLISETAELASGPGYPPGFQSQFERVDFAARINRRLESERRVLRALIGIVDTVSAGDIGHDGEKWTVSSYESSQALERAFAELERANTFQQSLLAEDEKGLNDLLERLAPSSSN